MVLFQTGDPYKNEDGSIYHYDPMNPPAGFSLPLITSPQSPQKHILSPKKSIKERPPSPNKKRNMKMSPSKKPSSSFINSSTSPSLPFTPTPTPPPAHQSQSRMSCHYGDGVSQQQQQQQYPVYSTSFTSVPQQEAALPYYQPQCVVYAPYSVPVQSHYEGRLVSYAKIQSWETFYIGTTLIMHQLDLNMIDNFLYRLQQHFYVSTFDLLNILTILCVVRKVC